MKVMKYEMPKSGYHKIVQLGDIHIGAMNCRVDLLREAVESISKEKNTRVLLAGDLCDCVGHSDTKRFNPSEVDTRNFTIRQLGDMFRQQSKFLVEILKPIKHQIIAAVIGNHEITPAKYHHFNVYDDYCERLDIPDHARLGEDGIIKIVCNFGGNDKVSRNWVIKHGTGGAGSTPGYAINNILKNFEQFDCDIHTMAHIHRMETKVYRSRGISNKCNVIERRKFYGSNGSFLDSLLEGTSCYGDKLKGPLPDIGYIYYEMKRDGKRNKEQLLKVEL